MPEWVARFLVLSASNRLINGDWVSGRWQNTGIGGTTHGGAEFCTPAVEVAERVEALSGLPWPGGSMTEAEVARWLFVSGQSWKGEGEHFRETTDPAWSAQMTAGTLAARVDSAGASLRLERPVADACPLFVELCCGSAAVTLKLLGGAAARPPVSYMGAKTGYAEPILWTLGLRSGQGAAAVLLNDPGPWSRVWRVLTTPAGCAEVARIIRGWVGEDARALWERLRAEPVPDDEGEAAASWLVVCGWTGLGGNLFDGERIESETGVHIPLTRERMAKRVSSGLRFPAGTLVLGEDAADVTPEWVARWAFLHQGSIYQKGEAAGIGRPEGKAAGNGFGAQRPVAEVLVGHLDTLPPLSAAVSNLDAAAIEPVPPLPPGTCVFIDPPYFGDGSRKITGYAHEFPRASVVEVAERWKAAGARVAVSECVALPELMERGWYSVEITDARKGQRRTFSNQKAEWLTLSHPPEWEPAQQQGLFDAV